jgi:hypothetical protein
MEWEAGFWGQTKIPYGRASVAFLFAQVLVICRGYGMSRERIGLPKSVNLCFHGGMIPSAVCTLFEKDYHYGVGALANSLYKSGFRGPVYAGYRGNLPKWAASARKVDERTSVLAIGDGMELIFIRLDTKMHFANYKPTFMLELMKGVAKELSAIHYMDPDMVLKCEWRMIEAWADGGVGIVVDARGEIGPRNPLRNAWAKWLETEEFEVVRRPEYYFNTGYVGVSRAHLGLLERWEDLIARTCAAAGVSNKVCLGTSRSDLFYLPEQDAFNLAAMVDPTPLNSAGPDAMDFAPYGFLFSHAIGPRKPWRGGFLAAALKGKPPIRALCEFFKHTKNPLCVMSFWRRLALSFDLWLAVLIGRFYRKNF